MEGRFSSPYYGHAAFASVHYPTKKHQQQSRQTKKPALFPNKPMLDDVSAHEILKWCESVDHLVVPLAVDVGVSFTGI
jgi:hypothetical protein